MSWLCGLQNFLAGYEPWDSNSAEWGDWHGIHSPWHSFHTWTARVSGNNPHLWRMLAVNHQWHIGLVQNRCRKAQLNPSTLQLAESGWRRGELAGISWRGRRSWNGGSLPVCSFCCLCGCSPIETGLASFFHHVNILWYDESLWRIKKWVQVCVRHKVSLPEVGCLVLMQCRRSS